MRVTITATFDTDIFPYAFSSHEEFSSDLTEKLTTIIDGAYIGNENLTVGISST
tara:strand:- start:248 stop:409 length:162 start_codon:yes stop_codon:yes gene_type:complete